MFIFWIRSVPFDDSGQDRHRNPSIHCKISALRKKLMLSKGVDISHGVQPSHISTQHTYTQVFVGQVIMIATCFQDFASHLTGRRDAKSLCPTDITFASFSLSSFATTDHLCNGSSLLFNFLHKKVDIKMPCTGTICVTWIISQFKRYNQNRGKEKYILEGFRIPTGLQ